MGRKFWIFSFNFHQIEFTLNFRSVGVGCSWNCMCICTRGIYSQSSLLDNCTTGTSSSGPSSILASSDSIIWRTRSRWLRDTKGVSCSSSAMNLITLFFVFAKNRFSLASYRLWTNVNSRESRTRTLTWFIHDFPLTRHCRRCELRILHLIQLLQQPFTGFLMDYSRVRAERVSINC